MEFGFTFNAEEVPASERGEFKPIPSGTRVMLHITEADIVKTRSGSAIKFSSRILNPFEYENWVVRGFINVQNANETCQKIGQRELADLCLAIGKPKVEATEDLLFAPFEATLGIKRGGVNQKASDEAGEEVRYSDENVIKKYHVNDDVKQDVAKAYREVNAKQAAPAPAPAAKPAATRKPWQTAA